MMIRRPPPRHAARIWKPADLARELRAEIHRSATRRRPPISLPTVQGLKQVVRGDEASDQ